MQEISITLSLDDWMTIRKTLNRGLEGYSEDLQFLIKATTVMNLKKGETEIVMSRARVVTAQEEESRYVCQKLNEQLSKAFDIYSEEE
jgi:hypothetical protein